MPPRRYLTSEPAVPLGTLGPMGFNPFRPQRRTLLDVILVVVAIGATLALVAWGFLGG